MPINILMPALSPTMTEGNLAKWRKNEGDSVSSGDVIAEIETDKATMEVEAVDEGVLGRIVVPEGAERVAVNSVIGVLLVDGEDTSALGAATAAASNGHGPSPAAPAVAMRKRNASWRNSSSNRPRGAARRHGGRNAPRRRPCSSSARRWRNTRRLQG